MLPQDSARFKPAQQQNTRSNSLLAAALWYADHGYYVFPLHTPLFDNTGKCTGCTCEEYKRSKRYLQSLTSQGKEHEFDPNYKCKQPGKCPRVKWIVESTTDAETIKGWWSKWPHANIGIDCGKSELLVLDADSYKENYKGGTIDLDENTIISVTGGGGAHFWYSQPASKKYGNGTGTLPAGIDIRGQGGYIVAPPSLHHLHREYAFRDGHSPRTQTLAAIPASLLVALDGAQRPGKGAQVVLPKQYTPAPDLSAFALSPDILELIKKGVPNGQRSEADWRVAMVLVEAGASDEQIHGVFCNYAIGAKYDERGEDYLVRTIAKVRAKVLYNPSEELAKLRAWIHTAACNVALQAIGLKRIKNPKTMLDALVEMAQQRRTARVATTLRDLAQLAGLSKSALHRAKCSFVRASWLKEEVGEKGTVFCLDGLLNESGTIPKNVDIVPLSLSSECTFFTEHRLDDAFTTYPRTYAEMRRRMPTELVDALGETALLLWDALAKGGTIKELAKATGLQEHSVRRALKRYKQAELLVVWEKGRANYYELHPNAEERLELMREHMVTAGVGLLRAARIQSDIAAYAQAKLEGPAGLDAGEVARLKRRRDIADAKAYALRDALEKKGINPGKIGRPSRKEQPIVTADLSILTLEELMELDSVDVPRTPVPNFRHDDNAEEWRTIPGWADYQASSLGRIRSIDRIVRGQGNVKYSKAGKVLRPTPNVDGYLYVTLHADGKKHGNSVHRLVALAFIGSLPEGSEIHHRNKDKTDNRPDNLEPMDSKQHARLHTQGESHPRSVLKAVQVLEIHNLIARGHTDAQIASKYGVARSTISSIRSGKSWRPVMSQFDMDKQRSSPITVVNTAENRMRAVSINWDVWGN